MRRIVMSLFKKFIAVCGVLSILFTYSLSAAATSSAEAQTSEVTETVEDVESTETEVSSESDVESGDTGSSDSSDADSKVVIPERIPDENGMYEFELKDLYMTVKVPYDIMIVTRDTVPEDVVFKNLKSNYSDTMAEMKASNYYLLAYANDYSYQLTVEMRVDEESKDIYDFNLLTEEQLRTVKDSLVNSKLYHAVSHPPHNQAIFFNLGIEYKNGDKSYYGAQSYTIINGMQIAITLQTFTGHDLTNEQYTLASEILKSVHFTRVSEKPEAFSNTDQYIIIFVIIILIIGVALALAIVLTMYRKNTKTLQSMEDELEETKSSENGLTLKDIIKKVKDKLRKNKLSSGNDDDEFIYDFDYSYIVNSDTEFDISLDDINAELEHTSNADEKNSDRKSEKAEAAVAVDKKNGQNRKRKGKKRKVTNYDVFNS